MTDQVRVRLVCPECGGPLPVEAATKAVECAQCGHASAPLAPATTIVVERTVMGATVSSAAANPCPRCKASLFPGDAHGVRLLGCGVCGGIFLDNVGSTRIVSAHDEKIADMAERARMRAATAVDTRPADLPCPSCAAPMRRVNARGVVEIDICASHGTWFDGGELNRVMDAYRPVAVDDSELRMAEFRNRQMRAISAAEDASATGAFGVTLGVLGVLGALVAGSRS
jgi:Zn-finger nucleic acid-binding protein